MTRRGKAWWAAVVVVSSVPMWTGLADKFVFFPETLAPDVVLRFEVPTEEVTLSRPDGAAIHGMWFTPAGGVPDDAPVVLYFHGNAGSLRSWGEVGADFARQGLRVFMIDYRGFGKSSGTRSEAALFGDGLAARDHIRRRCPGAPLWVYGRSIGSGIASYVGGQGGADRVILETPFVDFADVAEAHFPWLPVRALSPYRFDNAAHLAEVSCPVFIFHGTADEVVPYRSGQRLAERLTAAGRAVTFTTVPGGGHNSLAQHRVFRAAQRAALGLPPL